MVVAAKLWRRNSSSMSSRSCFTENPPSLRPKLPRQPQRPAQPHAEASAAAAASFKSALRLGLWRPPLRLGSRRERRSQDQSKEIASTHFEFNGLALLALVREFYAHGQRQRRLSRINAGLSRWPSKQWGQFCSDCPVRASQMARLALHVDYFLISASPAHGRSLHSDRRRHPGWHRLARCSFPEIHPRPRTISFFGRAIGLPQGEDSGASPATRATTGSMSFVRL
jgi:hypothetical protein